LRAPLAAGAQGAAHVIVSTRLLTEVGDRLPVGAAPMELVILNPSYEPFKKFLKHPVDGWSFQDYTPTASVSASTPPATRRAARGVARFKYTRIGTSTRA